MLRVLQVQLIQQNISVEHKDNSLGNYVCHIHLRFCLAAHSGILGLGVRVDTRGVFLLRLYISDNNWLG